VNAIKGVLLLCALAVTLYCLSGARACPFDFPQYYCASRLYLSGQASVIYDEARLGALEHQLFPQMPITHKYFKDLPADPSPMWYPPYAMPFLCLLAILPQSIAMVGWSISGVASLLGSLILLGKAFEIRFNSLVWIFSVVALSGPCAQAIVLGQPIFFFLLGLSAAVYGIKKERTWLAVAGLSLLLAKPPLVVPILLFLLGAKRYRILLGVAACGVGLLLLSVVTEGAHTYQSYLDLLKYASNHPETMGMTGGLTVRSQILRILPQATGESLILSVPLYISALASSYMAGRVFGSSQHWLEAGLMAALPISLVTAPYLHPYDLLITLPSAFAFATAKLDVRLPYERELLLLAYAFLFVFFIYSPIYFSGWALNPHLVFFLIFAITTTCAVWRNRAVPFFAQVKTKPAGEV
jgi:Glycosyltransferase family 87